MNFCDICQSILTKEIRQDGNIYFVCSCQFEKMGRPSDTLMVEVFPEVIETSQKEVFIENSPFDPAGCVIKKDCPECGLDFMTLVRVGRMENVIYTCLCGYKTSYADYKARVSKDKS